MIDASDDLRIRRRLIEIARSSGCVSYERLYEEFGVEPQNQDEKFAFHEALGRVSSAEAAHGRPPLGGIVAYGGRHPESGIPGDAFFVLCRHLGLYEGRVEDDAKSEQDRAEIIREKQAFSRGVAEAIAREWKTPILR